MPIYEYRCNQCGHELEAIQKLSESRLTHCPACETDGLQKRISATVFRLRGTGWYETDFKSDRKKNVAGDDAAAPGKDNGADKTQEKAGSGGAPDKSSGNGQSEKKQKEPAQSGSNRATPNAAASEKP